MVMNNIPLQFIHSFMHSSDNLHFANGDLVLNQKLDYENIHIIFFHKNTPTFNNELLSQNIWNGSLIIMVEY
jgi:hypothetical protein